MPEVVPPAVPEPLPAPAPAAPPPPRRIHLVVVTTHAADTAVPGAAPTLVARYWHPRRAEWMEQPVDSVEHALRLFGDELAWTLRQQQVLDSPERHELIFEARVDQLELPSAAEVLEEVGLPPEDVSELIRRVEEPD
jgi:hypothetical protein